MMPRFFLYFLVTIMISAFPNLHGVNRSEQSKKRIFLKKIDPREKIVTREHDLRLPLVPALGVLGPDLQLSLVVNEDAVGRQLVEDGGGGVEDEPAAGDDGDAAEPGGLAGEQHGGVDGYVLAVDGNGLRKFSGVIK